MLTYQILQAGFDFKIIVFNNIQLLSYGLLSAGIRVRSWVGRLPMEIQAGQHQQFTARLLLARPLQSLPLTSSPRF